MDFRRGDLCPIFERPRKPENALYELPLLRWMNIGDSRVKGIDFIRAIAEMAGIYRTYRLPKDSRLVTGSGDLAGSSVHECPGAIGTLVHYLTLTLAVEVLRQRVMVATTVGSILGAMVNYVLNYHFTFASRASHTRTAPRFLAVATLSAALNFAGMWVAVELLRVQYLIAQSPARSWSWSSAMSSTKFWTFGTSPPLVVGVAVDTSGSFAESRPAVAAAPVDADVQASAAWDTPDAEERARRIR